MTIPFAVWHEGVEKNKGRWVLDQDGERFLLADDEGKFYWRGIHECRLVRVHTPDHATLVLPFGAKPQNGIITAANLAPPRL